MAKWADWLISDVRYDEDHSRIVKVRARLDNDKEVGPVQEQFRTEVVSNIDGGKTYCTIFKGTDDKWKRGEDVRVIKIEGEKFIRTDANQTNKDNLGNLPEF